MFPGPTCKIEKMLIHHGIPIIVINWTRIENIVKSDIEAELHLKICLQFTFFSLHLWCLTNIASLLF